MNRLTRSSLPFLMIRARIRVLSWKIERLGGSMQILLDRSTQTASLLEDESSERIVSLMPWPDGAGSEPLEEDDPCRGSFDPCCWPVRP